MLALTLLHGLVYSLLFGAHTGSADFNTTAHAMIFDEILLRTLSHYNISNVPIFIGANDENRTAYTAIAAGLDRQLLAARYIFTAADNSTPPDNSLRNHITNDALSVVLCDAPTDRIWRVVDQRLRKLRAIKIVVVSTSMSLEPVAIFAKLWQLQFLQGILLFNNTIYSYTPYPQLRVFQVSDSSADPYPSSTTNLQGYLISTPVENDLPRIFFVHNRTGHAANIRGFAYRIFMNFAQRMNITLHISNSDVVHEITSSLNKSLMAERIGSQELEISMHPYALIGKEEGILSYPIFKLDYCLIVPWQNEILRCWYPIRPLQWGTWIVICFSVAYFAVALVWTSPCVPHDAPFLTKLSRTFLESLSQVAFLAHVYSSQQPSLRYFLIYLQLALFGFVLTSWYNNLLSSFYTTILVGEQLDTFESLIEAQLPILIRFDDMQMLLNLVPPKLLAKIKKLVKGANSSVQMTHLLTFNSSYAYPATEERWNFLNLQEQYSNKRVSRFSRICLGSPNIGFPMRLDSHLERALNQFISDVKMAGLDVYWLTADFNDALKEGYVRLVNNVLPIKAIDLYTLYVAWVLLFIGLSIAFCVFLIELRVARGSRILIRQANKKNVKKESTRVKHNQL